MKDTLASRIAYAITNIDETYDLLAKNLGVSRNTIMTYKKCAGDIKGVVIENLVNKYEFNPTWLLTGQGAMKNDHPNTEHKDHCSCKERISNSPNGIQIPQWPGPPSDDFEYVAMAEAALNAGGGNFVFSERTNGKFYSFRKNFLRHVATSVKNLILMKVEGDSMSPEIKHGDSVLIDTGRCQPQNFGYFAIGVDDVIVVKQLEMLGEGKICLRSINKRYGAVERDLDRVRIIGQVVWIDRIMIQTSTHY